MFDWVKKLLFEEEETIVEENKLEEIDFTKVNNLENIITETEKVEVKEEPVVETVQTTEEVKEEKVNTVPIKKEFNIQLDTPTTPTVQETTPRRRVERDRTERVEREKTEKETSVEMMSVISPMFGGKEVKKTSQKTTVAVTPKKKDSIGIVISPMYGQKELQEHQVEAKVRIEENKNKQMPLVEDDDWKNDIPLDELISSVDETNDCVQFSLFGDNQTINE